ncbi:hypothetical protein D3C72_2559470 [compost metagenome]
MAGKGAAMTGYATDFQARSMAQKYVLDDRQAQAGAAGVGGAAGVDPVEALGQAWQVLGVDTDA